MAILKNRSWQPGLPNANGTFFVAARHPDTLQPVNGRLVQVAVIGNRTIMVDSDTNEDVSFNGTVYHYAMPKITQRTTNARNAAAAVEPAADAS